MTRKLTSTEKVNRKPISRACKFCHGKHLQCDQGRPCKNCIKRGLQDTCESIQRKRAKYLVEPTKSENEMETNVSSSNVIGAISTSSVLGGGSSAENINKDFQNSNVFTGITQPKKPNHTTRKLTKKRNKAIENTTQSQNNNNNNNSNTEETSLTPLSSNSNYTPNTIQQNTNGILEFVPNQIFQQSTEFMDHINSVKSDGTDIHSSISNLSTPQALTPQQQQYLIHQQQQQIQSLLPHFQRKPTGTFGLPNTEKIDINKFVSKYANQEYLQLSEILDNNFISPSSPTSKSHIFHNYNYNNPEFRTAFQSDNNIRAAVIIPNNDDLLSNKMDVDLQNAMVDGDYISPLIQRHLIKTPNDVYLANFSSYNYPKAYLALLDYLKERFKKDQLYAIAETMAAYRPRFIAATRSLVEMDLLFAERSFQRSLLEYESMSMLSSSPTIMWRRTGEIVAVSSEFSSLTNYTKPDLLSKRTFIVEIMSDCSALDYFKRFSTLAFSEVNAVVISDLCLVGPDGNEIPCCSTWTVKRDVFDIPMLIVGQFLPILIAN